VSINKKVHWYKDKAYRSKEETEFAMWLEEAEKIGVVLSHQYEPKTFDLAPVKYNGNKFLLRKQIYTPDWLVKFDEKFNLFVHGLILKDNVAWIDIKGIYGRGMMNSSAYTFPVLQKWLFDKYDVFVNKVVARDLTIKDKITRAGFFRKTWVPEPCIYMKNRTVLTRAKAFQECKTLKEISLNGLFT